MEKDVHHIRMHYTHSLTDTSNLHCIVIQENAKFLCYLNGGSSFFLFNESNHFGGVFIENIQGTDMSSVLTCCLIKMMLSNSQKLRKTQTARALRVP